MARDTDALRIRKWAAASALKQTPEDAGLTRAVGLPAAYGVDQFLSLEVFNQIWGEVTAAAVEIAERGILEWSTDQRFEHPSWCTGSDGHLYRSVQASGGSDPAQDPVTDANHVSWRRLAVDVPNSSQTERGAIRTATEAETIIGTATSPAVTPAGLRAAIAAAIAAIALPAIGEQRYAAAGAFTFSWPWQATKARIVLVGGGGGGGGGSANTSGSVGGTGSTGETTTVGTTTAIGGRGGLGGIEDGPPFFNGNPSRTTNGGRGRGGTGVEGRHGDGGQTIDQEITGLSLGMQITGSVGAGGAGGTGALGGGNDGEAGGSGWVLILPVY